MERGKTWESVGTETWSFTNTA